jgi:hypothetical protein
MKHKHKAKRRKKMIVLLHWNSTRLPVLWQTEKGVEKREKQKSPILNKIKMKCYFKMEDIDYSGEAYFLNLIKH